MCHGVDVEVKRFLTTQKLCYFVECCGILTPAMGSVKIWSTGRSLESRSNSSNTGVFTDPDSHVLRRLQEGLVSPHIAPVNIPLEFLGI